MAISSAGQATVRELLIISGLVGTQVVSAVYVVFLSRVLALGVDSLFIVILGSLIEAVFLLPFAVALERKKWPARLSLALMLQFVLIAFGGVTALQGLMLLGIKKTSPAIAAAMPNLAPGLIFIIAAIFRFEKFELRCNYTRAKLLGTLVCLTGSIIMSFLQSPQSTKADLAGSSTYHDWIIGCSCILSGVVVMSCNTVLQAAAMVNFPAPFSLCVITSLIGSTLTTLMQIITQGKLDVGSPVISMMGIFAFLLMGGLATSFCLSFKTWCVNQKGPVMVSIFSPIQTICSVLLSAIYLRKFIDLASFAGMVTVFIGLYIVLWAKNKERCRSIDVGESSVFQNHDTEKPLLS